MGQAEQSSVEGVHLRDAHEALRRGAWSEGRDLFSTALEADESPEAYDGLATCCRFLGALDESLAARERAYRLYHERGDIAAAVMAAAWLGRDSGLPRAEASIARAWFAVARRLAPKTDSALALGTLDYYEGQFVLLGEIDAPRAGDLGARARAAGRECGNVDLEMQGLSLQGVAAVAEGRVEEGMALVEEAAAAVFGGELSGVDAAGWVCCHVIYACERVSDTRRAAEWCVAMRGFCERWDMPGMFGMCRAHHGSVLMHEGRWAQAEEELNEAAALFLSAAPALAFEAVVRLCELRLRQGRLDEIEPLAGMLADSHVPWLTLPSQAGVALAQGDPESARAMLDRYLRMLPDRERTGRAAAYELAVQAHVAFGDIDAATVAAQALSDIAAVAGTDRLRGAAELARGRVLAATGKHPEARTSLETAIDLLSRAAAPYDIACARISLAETLSQLGHPQLAVSQLSTARDALHGLGARLMADAAHQRLGELTPANPRDRWNLSERELDVLRLAAEGCSNTEIAERLGLSHHTVHRHMANVRTKLGGDSKAAVVARATREGLI
ncbi:MAG TPA: LuxR C-terminal-related transcriptional regulator [Acidimicrobiales bacterium]|nr:LuxR C-terminal-related transcriptional regulator [Acidimicrobiales bacterium]